MNHIARNIMVRRLASQMQAEMNCPINVRKGDDWRDEDSLALCAEIVYHATKLIDATVAGNQAGVLECAADTANCCAMLADQQGALIEAPQPASADEYTPDKAAMKDIAGEYVASLMQKLRGERNPVPLRLDPNEPF